MGQIIMLDHEQNIGAGMLADSLTDLVANRRRDWYSGHRGDEPPVVARVNIRSLTSVQAAAHPELQVLSIGVWDGGHDAGHRRTEGKPVEGCSTQ